MQEETPTDKALRRDFIRWRAIGRTRGLEVLDIRWDGPSTPISRWRLVGRFGRWTAPAVQQIIAQRLLHNPRWFRVCRDCGERRPNGWMCTDAMCQRCAEKQGVVF